MAWEVRYPLSRQRHPTSDTTVNTGASGVPTSTLPLRTARTNSITIPPVSLVSSNVAEVSLVTTLGPDVAVGLETQPACCVVVERAPADPLLYAPMDDSGGSGVTAERALTGGSELEFLLHPDAGGSGVPAERAVSGVSESEFLFHSDAKSIGALSAESRDVHGSGIPNADSIGVATSPTCAYATHTTGTPGAHPPGVHIPPAPANITVRNLPHQCAPTQLSPRSKSRDGSRALRL